MSELEDPLAAAMAGLEAAAAASRPPDRYLARALLVALGERLVACEEGERSEPELEAVVERARALGDALGERWRRAAGLELELACAEHVHSADPRHIGRPDYDWGYTLEARGRLTARLVAARALGLRAPERLLEKVEAADRLLAEHLGEGKAPS